MLFKCPLRLRSELLIPSHVLCRTIFVNPQDRKFFVSVLSFLMKMSVISSCCLATNFAPFRIWLMHGFLLLSFFQHCNEKKKSWTRTDASPPPRSNSHSLHAKHPLRDNTSPHQLLKMMHKVNQNVAPFVTQIQFLESKLLSKPEEMSRTVLRRLMLDGFEQLKKIRIHSRHIRLVFSKDK